MTHRCPTCGDNAVELERFTLPCTSHQYGQFVDLEHVRIRCTNGHHYTFLAEDLARL